MDAKKNVLMSVSILFLLLCCLVAGKFLFVRDTEIVAQAQNTGNYQVSCATNPSGNGNVTCVIIDTVTGMVVNIIRPKLVPPCDVNGGPNAMSCNATFKKNAGKGAQPGQGNQPAKNQWKKSAGAGAGKNKAKAQK